MTGIAVIGASLAGLSTARAARALGYDGTITVVGYEKRRPYDRPPLSKGFLAGDLTETDIALQTEADDALDVDWKLGRWALQLDPSQKAVILDGGETLTADHVVVATGCRARRLGVTGSELPGVHTLRTLDDAVALRDAMKPGMRLVIIGAGFIGAEIASTAKGLGLDVTVLEFGATPLARPLGETVGAIVGRFHEANGVDLRCNTVVDHLVGDVHAQLGMGSRSYRTGGVLVPSEHHIGAFHEWVLQMLSGTGSASPSAHVTLPTDAEGNIV